MDRPDDDSDPTFGARFLEEWKRLGGPLAGWTYAEIQDLRDCDREGLAQALRRRHPLTPHAALARIRGAESPESLARELLLQAQAAAQTNFWLLLLLMP